jgi:hypothetical protein
MGDGATLAINVEGVFCVTTNSSAISFTILVQRDSLYSRINIVLFRNAKTGGKVKREYMIS